MFDYDTLRFIWWALIGVLIIGFAVTDGLDMGVGMLSRLIGKNNDERRSIINTVAPHWDGNQVWLITLGGAIFAAWPLVYATAFSGFYFAMMLTLFALFFRPVAFDYRSKVDNNTWKESWDNLLFLGSFVPALVFGVALGNLLQGVPFDLNEFMRSSYHGSFWQLLNPFALISGLLSVSMLLALAGGWVSIRADKVLMERAEKIKLYFNLISLVLFAVAGVYMYFAEFGYAITSGITSNMQSVPTIKTVELSPWFNNYDTYPIMQLFPALGLAFFALSVATYKSKIISYLSTNLAIIMVIITFGTAMFPFIMPSSLNPAVSLTIWDSTASLNTLNAMLVAAVIFVPLILIYTTWCYVKMWRRVSIDEIKEQSHNLY
jgi:cytochrome d ubiquinol oxidase subunit II